MDAFIKQAMAADVYQVKVNNFIEDNQIIRIHDSLICNEKMMYRILFIHGVDEKSLDIACQMTLDTINQKINQIFSNGTAP